MNVRKMIASLAMLGCAGVASAQGTTFPYVEFKNIESTKTRAEVMAELEESRAREPRVMLEHEYPVPAMNFESVRSRADVIAEMEQAKADGMYMQSDYDTQYPMQQAGMSAHSHLASTDH